MLCGRAHNSSPHKWYCHFWDWHNWYLTLLIKLKLILVNFFTLNYWYWAQFTLTLLKLDISDLQNDWHLQLLIFGIFGTSCFWFLELFIFSMSDIKHDWYRTWLTLAYLILWISGIEHYQKLGVAVIIYYWFHTACIWFWMAKDVGVASDGNFSSYLIGRSWYNHFRSFSMGGNGGLH